MKSSVILPVLVVVILAVLGVVFFSFSKQSQPRNQNNVQISDPLPINNSGQENNAAMTSGKYTDYSIAALNKATQGEGRALLFFHASWCPTCKAAEKDINSKLNKIPEDLTILKTDYDKEKELKKKYGVTYQHTFVQVDANGEMITKWNGGGLNEILSQIE